MSEFAPTQWSYTDPHGGGFADIRHWSEDVGNRGDWYVRLHVPPAVELLIPDLRTGDHHETLESAEAWVIDQLARSAQASALIEQARALFPRTDPARVAV